MCVEALGATVPTAESVMELESTLVSAVPSSPGALVQLWWIPLPTIVRMANCATSKPLSRTRPCVCPRVSWNSYVSFEESLSQSWSLIYYWQLDAKATCSNSEFTTTTTTPAPTTTPSPEALKTKCSEAATASGTTAKFFYVKYTDDATCRSYLYCQREGDAPDYDYTTVFLTCKSPKIYFDSITSACSATKPADCT